MIRKVLRIAVDAIVMVIVFFITTLVVDLIFGKVVGTTKDASGAEKLKGGGATSITLFLISGVIAIAFAIWFYKFLSNRKSNKAKE